MTDDDKPQHEQKITASADYFPETQTAILTDSNNNQALIRDITHEQYNQISAEFLAKSTLSSTSKTTELSKSLAAGSLMEAGVPPTKENKDTKKSE